MPGFRAALPAALLLLSSFPPAAAERPLLVWIPGETRVLNPSDPQASRAARVALQDLNYREASPSRLRGLRKVEKATLKITSGGDKKYYLQFSTEDYLSGEDAGRCLATVLYQRNHRIEVHSKCLYTPDKKQIQEKDKRFYEYLRHQIKPIIAHNIPDNYGNIDHAHLLLWGLAIAGSSNIMLEKSTEDWGYDMARVVAVRQWIRKDNVVQLEFLILILQIPTQEAELCHMHLKWIFGHPLREKHSCTSYNHGLEDGSGHDFGSAAGMFHEKEGNF